MKKKENTRLVCCLPPAAANASPDGETPQAARRHMEEAFAQLLMASPDEGLRWTGTKTDLTEIIYTVYVDAIVRDEEGFPATLRAISERIADNLHVRMPRNLSSKMAKARARRTRLLERYAAMRRQGVANPLERYVE